MLIEADREENTAKSRKFDWDELKTTYNGRASRARGMKNSGNETYEPPFRGAIVITQNADVSASEAILQRIVHLYLDKSSHSPQSKAATDQMNIIAVKHLSFFLQQAVINEARVMETIKNNTPVYEQRLLSLPEVKSVRIAKNHAQIMALADAFSEILKLHPEQHKDIHACIQQLVIERQQAIGADHPVVQQFWETYEYLNGDDKEPVLNHSRNDRLIAINLNHFVCVASENKQQMPLLADLKKYLKSSKNRKFYAIKPVNSALETRCDSYAQPKTVKCWLFVKEGSQ